MKHVFVPIALDRYLELHMKNNPADDREQVNSALLDALRTYQRGERCDCGEPIWVIGSALTGYRCFTCITGEAMPDQDYELEGACGERRP